MKKILFIDRDGTLIREAPPTYQVDHFDKLEFYPEVFRYMYLISKLDYELVMVTNQDGLGTEDFPEDRFWPIQQHVIKSFANEGICFHTVHIDRSRVAENHPNRKPGTGMLRSYIDNPSYDIANSFVIGDRITDVALAKNLGCKAIWINSETGLGEEELKRLPPPEGGWKSVIALETGSWERIYEFLKLGDRQVHHERNTKETRISIDINLDGGGKASIDTGLNFFNHMLEQLSSHSGMDMKLSVKGDLEIDEHHTIEDTAIALGEAMNIALGNKSGIERYGFLLPMDESLAMVALDFGGRPWLVWEAAFKREKIGDMPTEMFFHFFKSFSDSAKCNLHIKVKGENEHHMIESIFKGLARAIKMAIRRDPDCMEIPTTKGSL